VHSQTPTTGTATESIYGDCQTVINQLQGTWNVGRLEPYYKRVRALEGTFKKKVRYYYLGETDATYKRVDRLSKLAHGPFKQVVK
jgi:hypothetical protein